MLKGIDVSHHNKYQIFPKNGRPPEINFSKHDFIIMKATEYTFVAGARETFSRIDHMLDNKISLSKFKKIEIISDIFSDHNTMRLDINYKKKSVRNTNTWRLNNTFLNNQQVT